MLRWLLCVLGGLAAISAQQKTPPDEFDVAGAAYTPPAPRLVVETRLVEVGAVVRDAKGHAAAGLTRGDFEIEDQGKKREITAFSVESGGAAHAAQAAGTKPAGAPAAAARPPRLLALVFDDFSMTPGELMPVRAAAKRFLKEGLGSNDLASVFFVSSGQVGPFTADTAKLEQAVDRLTVRRRNASMSSCPYLSEYEAMAIAERIDPAVLPVKVQEAVACGLCQRRDLLCADKITSTARMVFEEAKDTSSRSLRFLDGVVKYMAQLEGRRVVVLASSGFISRSLEQESETVIDRALRGDVVIHALDAKGLFTQDLGLEGPSMTLASQMLRQSLGTRPQMENNDSLAVLAESTGGLFFHNNNDLALGFHELGLAPEVSYTLGFAPAGAPDNRYHNLKVRLTNRGHYSVQARHGYFSAAAPAAAPATPPERAIDREVQAVGTREDVPASVIDVSPAVAGIHVLLHLDTPHLPFGIEAGVRYLRLQIVAALFDESSGFVSGQEIGASFALKPETFDRLAEGQNIGIRLQAGPGKYRLRCVIQEPHGQKMTTINRPVEIRAN
jgi:VWFA-related protein